HQGLGQDQGGAGPVHSQRPAGRCLPAVGLLRPLCLAGSPTLLRPSTCPEEGSRGSAADTGQPAGRHSPRLPAPPPAVPGGHRMAVDGGRRMSQRSPIWITGPRPANIRTLQAQSLTSFRRGMSTRPRGSFLAAPTEVQRLAIRAELADAVAAPGAALAIPSVHLHEAPVLLRLVVVRV